MDSGARCRVAHPSAGGGAAAPPLPRAGTAALAQLSEVTRPRVHMLSSDSREWLIGRSFRSKPHISLFTGAPRRETRMSCVCAGCWSAAPTQPGSTVCSTASGGSTASRAPCTYGPFPKGAGTWRSCTRSARHAPRRRPVCDVPPDCSDRGRPARRTPPLPRKPLMALGEARDRLAERHSSGATCRSRQPDPSSQQAELRPVASAFTALTPVWHLEPRDTPPRRAACPQPLRHHGSAQ